MRREEVYPQQPLLLHTRACRRSLLSRELVHAAEMEPRRGDPGSWCALETSDAFGLHRLPARSAVNQWEELNHRPAELLSCGRTASARRRRAACRDQALLERRAGRPAGFAPTHVLRPGGEDHIPAPTGSQMCAARHCVILPGRRASGWATRARVGPGQAGCSRHHRARGWNDRHELGHPDPGFGTLLRPASGTLNPWRAECVRGGDTHGGLKPPPGRRSSCSCKAACGFSLRTGLGAEKAPRDCRQTPPPSLMTSGRCRPAGEVDTPAAVCDLILVAPWRRSRRGRVKRRPACDLAACRGRSPPRRLGLGWRRPPSRYRSRRAGRNRRSACGSRQLLDDPARPSAWAGQGRDPAEGGREAGRNS